MTWRSMSRPPMPPNDLEHLPGVSLCNALSRYCSTPSSACVDACCSQAAPYSYGAARYRFSLLCSGRERRVRARACPDQPARTPARFLGNTPFESRYPSPSKPPAHVERRALAHWCGAPPVVLLPDRLMLRLPRVAQQLADCRRLQAD
jgi:hypothetical protein